MVGAYLCLHVLFLNYRPFLSGSRTKDSRPAEADEILPTPRLQSARHLWLFHRKLSILLYAPVPSRSLWYPWLFHQRPSTFLYAPMPTQSLRYPWLFHQKPSTFLYAPVPTGPYGTRGSSTRSPTHSCTPLCQPSPYDSHR